MAFLIIKLTAIFSPINAAMPKKFILSLQKKSSISHSSSKIFSKLLRTAATHLQKVACNSKHQMNLLLHPYGCTTLELGGYDRGVGDTAGSRGAGHYTPKWQQRCGHCEHF